MHSASKLDCFLEGLNQREPRIRFTCECSTSSAVFLDLRIYKPLDFAIRNKLSTSILYKGTNTFSFTMGSSLMPRHTFRCIAIGETVRALRNCDSRVKFEIYRRRLLHRFKLRKYPREAI